MKIGCTAWVCTAPRFNPPYEQAMQSIGELGFDGLKLILYDPADLETYWTSHRIDEITRR